MSQAVRNRPAGQSGQAGFGSLLTSEWTKLRSTRSFKWICIVSAVLSIGIAVLGGLTNNKPYESASSMAQNLLLGFVFVQFVFLGWGAQLGSTEFSTGMILASVSAVPTRTRLMVGKLTTVVVFTVIYGLMLAIGGLVIGWLLLGDRHGSFALNDPAVVRAVLLQPLFLALLAGIALGLGIIVKVPAGAVITALGIIVVPVILALFPSKLVQNIASIFPSLHSGAEVVPANQTLALSLVIMVCWLAAANVLAAAIFRRRDI